MQARSTPKLGESSWVSGGLLSSGLSPPTAATGAGGSAYSVSPGGISDASNTAQGGHPHAHAHSNANTAQHTLHGGFADAAAHTTTGTGSSTPRGFEAAMSYDTSTPGRSSMQSTRSSLDRRPHLGDGYPPTNASGGGVVSSHTQSSLPTSSTASHIASSSEAASNGTTQGTSLQQQAPITPSQSGFDGQHQHLPGTPGATEMETVPTSFDEATLRALCDMDCGMPLLYDRIKQSMVSATQTATFLKKRAAIEEEYARAMMKLSRSSAETYSAQEGKAGSFVNTWQSFMRTHDQLGENRLRFAAKLSEMSDELTTLSKEVDKNRKQARETGLRLERSLQEAEASVEKARGRFDSTAEDLERLLLLKSGESAKGGELQSPHGPGGKRTLGKAIGKSGLLFKNKNPQQILKQEEEIRARTSTASDAFRKEVLATQGTRQEYFNLQLPRILRALKESAEEIDNGLQYHLTRYAFLYESTVLGDGMAISPIQGTEGMGLKSAAEAVDNRADFKTFMQNYQVVHGRDYRGPRREGPYDEGFVQGTGVGAQAKAAAAARPATNRPIFGVHLVDQMARDGVEVPPILEKCAEAIEAVGLQNMGIYRLSGTTSKVARLKAKFDADWETVDLMNDEAINDINIIAGCLKLWFRELPEPLMTWELYQGFIDAAKVESERMRHIRMHERVNDLPDANYATLKYLMGHLDKIQKEDAHNQMSISNLAIVFGPTLLGPPPGAAPPGANGAAGPGGQHLADMSFQCKAVETILERYAAIFVDEGEEAPQ